MPRTAQTKGRCRYCGREMTCTGLGRHLRTCNERRKSAERADAGKGPTEALHHLQVRDAYGIGYWLHLEMTGSATLFELDHYLRAIWLDCCAHLSAFTIAGTQYENGGLFGVEESISMDEVNADAVFRPGLAFVHEYDFGTTTELSLRCLDQRRGKPTTEHPITLLARNDPVEVPCGECPKPARSICLDCYYESENDTGLGAYVCKEHAVGHASHDDYGGMMALFNSPRSGVCGYNGPAEPPY